MFLSAGASINDKLKSKYLYIVHLFTGSARAGWPPEPAHSSKQSLLQCGIFTAKMYLAELIF